MMPSNGHALPTFPSKAVNLYMQDFIKKICILQGLNGFLSISEENSEAEGENPSASDSPEKSFAGFKFHVLSMIHEVFMPFDPYAALHTNKHSESGTNQRVSVSKTWTH